MARLLLTYRGQTNRINTVTWAPNGRFLASGTGVWGERGQGSVHVFHSRLGKGEVIYRRHASGARARRAVNLANIRSLLLCRAPTSPRTLGTFAGRRSGYPHQEAVRFLSLPNAALSGSSGAIVPANFPSRSNNRTVAV